jgi:hypothetical protein
MAKRSRRVVASVPGAADRRPGSDDGVGTGAVLAHAALGADPLLGSWGAVSLPGVGWPPLSADGKSVDSCSFQNVSKLFARMFQSWLQDADNIQSVAQGGQPMLYLSPAIILVGLLSDYVIQYRWGSIAPDQIPGSVLRSIALTSVSLKIVVYSASTIILFSHSHASVRARVVVIAVVLALLALDCWARWWDAAFGGLSNSMAHALGLRPREYILIPLAVFCLTAVLCGLWTYLRHR